MKKSEIAAKLFDKNIHRFKCTICDEGLRVIERKSLVCRNGHCFDIARSGYVNMLTSGGGNSKYDKALFVSRHIISEQGFFTPLVEYLAELISDDDIFILDAGCGEGSIIYLLMNELKSMGYENVEASGIDIAKEGVQLAAREHQGLIWMVGDITDIPFLSSQCDIILNILSPSNYKEFRRVLQDDGTLVKVIPGDEYLLELRQILFKDSDKARYSNETTIRHFKEHFNLAANKTLRYEFPIDEENLKEIITMTPLAWSGGEEKYDIVKRSKLDSITVELVVLAGKKK